jgi:peptide/nickel transport system substrate-binding protein
MLRQASTYKYVGTWLIDEWSKIGLHATQRVETTGPWFEAMRNGNFDVVLEASCQSVVNPLLDVQKALPASVFTENYGKYDDQPAIDLYQKMVHQPDADKQRVLMREFEKLVIDIEAHEFPMLWWHRIIPHRSYVKGWKISPSHYLNQDLAMIWLDK